MEETTIRECTTIEEFDGCVYLQREAFGLPDLELSPRRHLIVSRQAGGWTLARLSPNAWLGLFIILPRCAQTTRSLVTRT